MQGKIVKGIAGFYYVYAKEDGDREGNVYECKAKGIFRKDNIKPLVGDDVEMDVIDEEKKLGNIIDILPRKNALIRPAVANIDQALVIFAMTKPEPNLNLLDRFLLMMQQQGRGCIICFNKMDIASKEEQDRLLSVYEKSGCKVLFVSAREKQDMDKLRELLRGKTTTVAGPSGVGKSSIINEIQSEIKMETGSISEKIARGKHTTRHSELIAMGEDTYICDTPGFSSLGIFELEKEELKFYYPEFEEYENTCRFGGCVHVNEPDCKVQEAVEKGEISRERYENYKLLYEELKQRKKY
ncbi:MAG: ribosome small subunit-dependent GTPase A [Lachnospiraceae bacterium]|nr:ribosome small subunit-dependent GTPase A [Lachnospiraceae bacterium]